MEKMPTRMIREGFLDSERVNSLSNNAERIYFRLLLVADDYGRFDARDKIIMSKCFPLGNCDITIIPNCITEIKNAGLIDLYNINDKTFLQITNFNQRLRAKKSKFPNPETICPSNDSQVTGECQSDARNNVHPSASDSDSSSTSSSGDYKGTENWSEALKEAWARWEKHRKEKKKKLTPESIKEQIEFLNEIGEERAIAAIKRSIRGGWQGIFEDEKNKPKEYGL